MMTSLQAQHDLPPPTSVLAMWPPLCFSSIQAHPTFGLPICFAFWNTLSPGHHMRVPFSHANLSSALPFQVVLRECQERGQGVLAEMKEYTFHLSSA